MQQNHQILKSQSTKSIQKYNTTHPNTEKPISSKLNPTNPPQASWILIKQSLTSKPRTTTTRHTHHLLLNMATNPTPPTKINTTIINIATSTKRKRERERNRDRQGGERTRRRQDRRDNLGGEIGFRR